MPAIIRTADAAGEIWFGRGKHPRKRLIVVATASLYAAEVTTWPLSGVDLVVLSAWDMAQGDRSYVKGLSSLPSALAVVGARRSLLARWPRTIAGRPSS
jgi:hypothetical protein